MSQFYIPERCNIHTFNLTYNYILFLILESLNELVICRVDKSSGKAKGGDEVFLLCEKINRGNTAIRTFLSSCINNNNIDNVSYIVQESFCIVTCLIVHPTCI